MHTIYMLEKYYLVNTKLTFNVFTWKWYWSSENPWVPLRKWWRIRVYMFMGWTLGWVLDICGLSPLVQIIIYIYIFFFFKSVSLYTIVIYILCAFSFYLEGQTSMSLKVSQIVWGTKSALRRLYQTQDLIYNIHPSCIWSMSF